MIFDCQFCKPASLGALFFLGFCSPSPGIFFSPDHPFTMKPAGKQLSQAGRQASQASKPASKQGSKPAMQVSQSKQPLWMQASKPGRQQATN